MDMNKTNSSIDENEESLVGEVLSDDEVREKKQAIAKWQHSPVGFGSYITKSNDLIQRTKYSLPRNEQKVLFMLMSKIDQKNDKDASKYYSITFNDFAKLTGVRTVDTTYALNLKETIENLENRTFWVKKEPDSKVYRSISWLQKGSEVDFDKKEIRLRFNQDIWKDIAQLTSNYTSYSIEYLLLQGRELCHYLSDEVYLVPLLCPPVFYGYFHYLVGGEVPLLMPTLVIKLVAHDGDG